MAERPDRDLTSDPLDRGLAAAFAPGPAPGGVLDTLANSIGSVPRVLLRDTDAGFEGPRIKPASTEVPGAPGRYQLFGEIARGGMGAVLKGRDADLGRDLALKVLLEQHRDNPDFVRRFVEEAQIGGQLQHPGIVPVYELGSFPDRRPYFAMKLVKGRTLASLLGARNDPRDDLPRFLGIFEQVAQTVAYAHARGVIHRDLKPSNVMVGSFGEVQVMDWGLAKVLKEGGVADDERSESPPVEVSVIRTVRSGSSKDESQAGSVLGTPAYMAPEQARGDIERVDRRADVFGLGSILCEILAGQPAYTGPNGNEVFRKALRGDTADACARLGACGADSDLVALASTCLAPEPADRPRDAAAVAGRITDYLTGVQEKLRAAERERAVAEARAVEEGRRRKLQVGLAAAILALTTVGGLCTTYYLQQRQARVAAVARILGEATTLRNQARDHPDDPARWQVALAATRRVEDALGTGTSSDPEPRRQSDALRDEVQAGLDGAERDHRLLDRLVDIRSAKADDPDGTATDAAYADAFQEAGIDLAALPPAEAGAKIKARPPATALALAVALDDWAAVRSRRRGDRAGAKRLSDAARAADPDPWRRDLRAALDQTDRTAQLTALQAAARSARFDTRGAVSLDLLGTALDSSGDPSAAETVLREAQRRHPGDVWVNYDLALVCENRNRRDDAIRFYTAARSIRPESAHQLAHLLEQKGESDEAIAVFQDLARLRPRNAYHLACLGSLLQEVGRPKEAAPFLDAAVAAGREAIRLKPDDTRGHTNLGIALNRQGKLDEAVAEFRAAVRLKSDDATAHTGLGNALNAQGKLDEAVAAHYVAIRLKPDFAWAHYNLGNALKAQGNHEEAIAEFRAAIRLKPDDAWAHNNLGRVLCDVKHDYEGAIAEFRAAIRLKPDADLPHINLGEVLSAQGKHEEAVTEWRAAIRLKPDDSAAHNNLGLALNAQGKLDEAVAAYRAAIRLKPDHARAHYNLGIALKNQGKLDEAVAEYRAALQLQPDDARAHYNLGITLQAQGKLDEAIAAYRAAIRLKPDHAEAHCNLGLLLLGKNRNDAEALALLRQGHELGSKQANWRYPSAEWVRRAERAAALDAEPSAIRLKPDDAVAHNSLGRSLSAQGKLDEAIAEYRTVIRLKPDDSAVHNTLGVLLKNQGKLDEAVAEYRAAIRLQPDDALVHYNLGFALRAQRKLEDGLVAFRRAGELATPGSPLARDLPGRIRQTEQMIAVAGRLPAVLKGEDTPRDTAEGLAFGQLCYDQGRHAAAVRLWADAPAADPKLGDVLQFRHRFSAACSAALAGCGKSRDDPPPDEPARAALRQQALDWLKAELAAWARLLESGSPQARASIVYTLKQWRRDADLTGVREGAALAQLPEGEQKAWRELWSDVETLLKQAQGDRP